jgi:hypothetical protein
VGGRRRRRGGWGWRREDEEGEGWEVLMERGRAHTPRRQPPVANSLLPERRHLSVVFRPSVNLPDFMTRASRELMDSCDFFCLRAWGGKRGGGERG